MEYSHYVRQFHQRGEDFVEVLAERDQERIDLLEFRSRHACGRWGKFMIDDIQNELNEYQDNLIAASDGVISIFRLFGHSPQAIIGLKSLPVQSHEDFAQRWREASPCVDALVTHLVSIHRKTRGERDCPHCGRTFSSVQAAGICPDCRDYSIVLEDGRCVAYDRQGTRATEMARGAGPRILCFTNRNMESDREVVATFIRVAEWYAQRFVAYEEASERITQAIEEASRASCIFDDFSAAEMSIELDRVRQHLRPLAEQVIVLMHGSDADPSPLEDLVRDSVLGLKSPGEDFDQESRLRSQFAETWPEIEPLLDQLLRKLNDRESRNAAD